MWKIRMNNLNSVVYTFISNHGISICCWNWTFCRLVAISGHLATNCFRLAAISCLRALPAFSRAEKSFKCPVRKSDVWVAAFLAFYRPRMVRVHFGGPEPTNCPSKPCLRANNRAFGFMRGYPVRDPLLCVPEKLTFSQRGNQFIDLFFAA
jgi:hypothetical protein